MNWKEFGRDALKFVIGAVVAVCVIVIIHAETGWPTW